MISNDPLKLLILIDDSYEPNWNFSIDAGVCYSHTCDDKTNRANGGRFGIFYSQTQNSLLQLGGDPEKNKLRFTLKRLLSKKSGTDFFVD